MLDIGQFNCDILPAAIIIGAAAAAAVADAWAAEVDAGSAAGSDDRDRKLYHKPIDITPINLLFPV